ncbi:MAG: hypothetical protein EA344_03045 [Alkalicoccus sp.]|nr:MAG: hypothetical protein EA344_03045 [Alkalicoccus sp.]
MDSLFSILGWSLYVLLAAVTLIKAFITVLNGKKLISSSFVSGLIMILPLTLFLFIMNRPVDMGVLNYFWEELLEGAWSARYLAFFHLYLVLWWLHVK